MKVLSGRLRGRRIDFTPREGLRPTSDKVRAAVFDVLRDRCAGASVLDLYCGTGAMGIEALSEGAAAAFFVDSDAHLCRGLRESLRALKLEDSATIRRADAIEQIRALSGIGRRFDLVFLDPPYEKGLAEAALRALAESGLCGPDSLTVVETRKNEALPETIGALECARFKVYGDTGIRIYRTRRDFTSG